MIVREFYRTREDDGVNLYRTYSDEGKDIRKVGTDEVYAEAIDVEGAPYIYEEYEEIEYYGIDIEENSIA
jgi:hypothetical protein